MIKIGVNVLYFKIDNGNEIASTEVTSNLIFLSLTEAPSIVNNYRDDTLVNGQVFEYSRYAQTTVTAKFLLQFIDRGDFKMAKHDIFKMFAQKGIYRLRTGVEPEIIRYCRAGPFEITAEPGEGNYCTFEVPFENPSGMRYSRLRSDELKDGDFLNPNMNLDGEQHSYHFAGQTSFKVFNPSDITVDPEEQYHDLKIIMKHNGGGFTVKNTTTNTSWSYKGNLSGSDTLVLQGRNSTKNNSFDSGNTDYGYLTLAPDDNQFMVSGANDLDITFSFPFIYLG